MATQTPSAPAATPASLFGAPGITRAIEQKENNDGAVITLSQTSQVQATGLVPFRQTDVIYGWQVEAKHAVTLTLGGATNTASPYFPDQYFGNIQLNMQNQFPTINVASGIDAAIFQAMRPMRKPDRRNALYTNTSSLYTPATNQVSLGNYTATSTSILRRYELPAGLWFDQYFELAADGTPLNSVPLRTFVSPQYMAGTARIVTPIITMNPMIATTSDNAPYTTSGGSPAFSGTTTLNIRRIGIYQPQGAADSPPVYNWQYVRKTFPFSLAGVSSANIPIQFNGQILGLYVRLYSPTDNAVIAITNVSECDVQYGSGLYRFQDTPTDTQARYIAQHGTLLPSGVLAWDLALDDQDNITNRYALNTMNTSGIQLALTFTGTQSATAYAMVGVEGLQYVEL